VHDMHLPPVDSLSTPPVPVSVPFRVPSGFCGPLCLLSLEGTTCNNVVHYLWLDIRDFRHHN
jgi:hypothetical protein